MSSDWRHELDQAFGRAPQAPENEFDRILQRTRQQPGQAPARSSSQLWPALLCTGSLVLGVCVTIFVQPNASAESSTTSFSLLTTEVTSPYDESLEGLQYLVEQQE